MKLICYPVTIGGVDLRPAPRERDWMDASPDGFAYRCLPLVIANGHGWEILSQARHEVVWSGGIGAEDVEVATHGDGAQRAMSHFGSGVVTFDIGCVFHTEPAVDLWVTGPVNRPKDGIAPLSGVIEADWMPYTFTMNWMLTRPGQPVVFEAGEPICFFFPVTRGAVEAVEPQIRDITGDPDTLAAYKLWSTDRTAFLDALHRRDMTATAQGWQKTYFRGLYPDGKKGVPDHRTKLRAKPFKDLSGSALKAARVPSPSSEGEG